MIISGKREETNWKSIKKNWSRKSLLQKFAWILYFLYLAYLVLFNGYSEYVGHSGMRGIGIGILLVTFPIVVLLDYLAGKFSKWWRKI